MNLFDAVFLHGRDLLCEMFAFMHGQSVLVFFSSMKFSWHTRHMGLLRETRYLIYYYSDS